MSALKDFKSEYRTEGTVVTAVVLTLLFLLFIFRSFAVEPELDANEGGVEVQLGEPDMGGPDESPMTEAQETYNPPAEESVDEVLASDESDVNINTSETQKVETKKTEKQKEPEKKVDDAISDLANKFKNRTDKSKGQGDGDKKGTQGEKDGKGDNTKGGKGGLGDSPNLGVGLVDGFSLKGRKITQEPKLNDSYNSKGKVVVEILVNAKGKVVLANPGARGTTANDSKLLAIAKKLAYDTKFNPLSDGKSQNGTITFKFGLK